MKGHMGSKRILLIGGGGHCRSVLDCLLGTDGYGDIAIIDRQDTERKVILGIPVIGTDDDLLDLHHAGWTDAFVSLGSIGDSLRRKCLYKQLKEIGFSIPCVVDKTATVSGNARLESGVFVGKKGVVNAGTTIGTCAIINSGAIVEHDCKVGAFSHISPGAVLCGGVSVGCDTHVGANTVVRQNIVIGNNSLIGIGSVVTKDIPDDSEAFGNPCRVVKTV